MEHYLNALRDALKKQKMATLEIEDIVADHREMIEEAITNGLQPEAIESMFGQVDTLAASLASESQSAESAKKADSKQKQSTQYAKTFSPKSPYHVQIKLTIDDLTVVKSKDAAIHLTADSDWREKDYLITFEKDTLTLFAPKASPSFLRFFTGGTSKAIHFTLALPDTSVCASFTAETISADIGLLKTTAETLKLKTISGDIISRDCTANVLAFNTVSGTIESTQLEAESASISLISGDSHLSQLTLGNTLSIETVSGDLKVEGGATKTLLVRTVSGDFSATDFYPEKVSLRSVSGDVFLKNSRKTDIDIVAKKTVSGAIKIAP